MCKLILLSPFTDDETKAPQGLVKEIEREQVREQEREPLPPIPYLSLVHTQSRGSVGVHASSLHRLNTYTHTPLLWVYSFTLFYPTPESSLQVIISQRCYKVTSLAGQKVWFSSHNLTHQVWHANEAPSFFVQNSIV